MTRKIRYGDTWVDVSGGGGPGALTNTDGNSGVTNYFGYTTPSSPVLGDMWFSPDRTTPLYYNGSAWVPCADPFNEFLYSGVPVLFTVPSGLTSVDVTVSGGAGRAGNSDAYGYGNGAAGLGAEITGTLSVTPGETLLIYAGQIGGSGGGSNSSTGGWGYGRGGTGSYGATNNNGGGGGGSSAILQGGSPVVVAGGGGGGGNRAASAGGDGGDPGGDGTNSAGSLTVAGGGSSSMEGGNGSGTGNQRAGGGGGGYNGGLGGPNSGGSCEGGGGGSSLVPVGFSCTDGANASDGFVRIEW